MQRLAPITSSSRRNRAASAIRTAIFSGQFGPGEPLRELHLARDLQVSQPTVREALLELESDGLVVRTPNTGTSVTNMSAAEVRERLALREMLETMAMTEACTRMGKAEHTELNRCLERLSANVAANAYYESAKADLEFHQFIWDSSGNRTLARTLRQIAAPLFAFASMLRSTGAQELGSAMNSHLPLVRALCSREEKKIHKAVRGHLENSYDPFLLSGAEDCRVFAQSSGTRRAAGR